jgi:hypothetical protein
MRRFVFKKNPSTKEIDINEANPMVVVWGETDQALKRYRYQESRKRVNKDIHTRKVVEFPS